MVKIEEGVTGTGGCLAEYGKQINLGAYALIKAVAAVMQVAKHAADTYNLLILLIIRQKVPEKVAIFQPDLPIMWPNFALYWL